MKYLSLTCLLLIAGCASTAPPAKGPTPSNTSAKPKAQEKTKPINTYYQSALATLKEKGNRAEIRDFQRVREAFVESPTYNPYFGPASNLVESGLEQMDKKQWNSCAKTAAGIIEINYTNLAGQYIGMICNLNAGNKVISEGYKFSLNGLIGAIWSTGNGKTMKTAFHTYNTSEPRTFLQLHGLEIIDQASVRGKRGVFAVIEVIGPKTGEKLKLYFNITKQWAKRASAM